ncbi:hypothetical protein CM240_3010 [Clostridium bornimense]|uniref:Uncharacterized protein n=1 Tax=Clostridium bornimense TaxID=1216932 RepID=W6S6V4_9CLOT|nr:hypothetical protein [Clostridium bornimense]CDM70127.1 hypothetical protein CM240_3010 [Clostridium bornimense]
MKKYISILLIMIFISNISILKNTKVVKGAVGDDFNSIYFSINNLISHNTSFNLETENNDLTSVAYKRKNDDGSIDYVELENGRVYKYILLQTKIKDKCENALKSLEKNYIDIVTYVEDSTGVGKGEFNKLIIDAKKECITNSLPIKIFYKIDEEFYSYILVSQDGEYTTVSSGVGNLEFYKYWNK